jgi:hypothetical protein
LLQNGPNDFTITDAGQAAHLRCDHNCVVAPFAGGGQVRSASAFAPGFD